MSLLAGFAVYFVIWWTVLFCVLPLDVQSQVEAGEVVAGTAPGAPAAPHIRRKVIITSVLAGIVFALVYTLWIYADF